MNISILGCGWLGLPLAKRLLKKGHRVYGSTTSPEKLPLLAAEGIKSFQILVSAEGVTGDIQAFLSGVEILIIDIPPGLRRNPETDFSGGIRKLSEAIERAGLRKVFFVSSISVYKETGSMPVYNEKDAPNSTTNAARQLIAAERIFSENSFFEANIIRFGGLLGGERHPVKYMAGRKGLKNPNAPVNLIHLEDCLQVLVKILENQVFGEVFNVVHPLHPSREQYYRDKAVQAGLEPPEFDHSEPSVGKVVTSSGLRELGMEPVQDI